MRLGTPLDPSKLTKYARKALDRAGVHGAFRPWHGLRRTALIETAAAGVPGMFVQAKAGHAQRATMAIEKPRKRRAFSYSPDWTRTSNPPVNSSPDRGVLGSDWLYQAV